jgi:tRNA threonylcarbamoyl adenosine modification protein YeaZ
VTAQRILAIDTSTDMTTIALVDAGVCLGAAEHTDARGHVEAIGLLYSQIPQLDVTSGDFVKPDLIVCGVGPGPFTGLRVGIAFGETLALAWGCQVIGVCSLDAVAHNIVRTATPGSEFIAATDARRGEYYWARYSPVGARIDGPHVEKKDVVERGALERGGLAILTGHHPLGVDLAASVNSSEHLPLTPLYLRAPDAQPSVNRSGP